MVDQGRIVQICYISHDIEATCHKLHELLGVGPFLMRRRPIPAENVTYRGQPTKTPLAFSRAFVQSGDLNLEIIQPHSEEQNAFWDMFSKGEEGLHHVALFAKNYVDERDAFIAAGYPVATEIALSPDCSVSYIDTRPALGHMVELYEDHPILRAIYDDTRKAAEAWDGRELILETSTPE